jgi:hypothetical protein
LGIYHADLAFRNTIKISQPHSFTFKIIDFDKAFKVVKTKENDMAYESTKNLLDYWLKFTFDHYQPRVPY